MNQLEALIGSSAVPINVGQSLLFRVDYSVVSNTELRMRAIILNAHGGLTFYSEQLILPDTDSQQTFQFPLENGLLLTCSVIGEDGSTFLGTIYCRIGVLFNAPVAERNILSLTSGYVSSSAQLNFPYNPPTDSSLQSSPNFSTTLTPPAAGAELDYFLIANGSTTLYAFNATFTASAAVAIRTPTFHMKVDNITDIQFRSRTTITATQAWKIQGWRGPNMPADDATGLVIYFPIPENITSCVVRFFTVTTAIDAADQYSATNYSGAHNIIV